MVELSDGFAEDCICWVVCYTQVGLLSYKIQTTRGLMEVIRDNAGVTRKPSEIDQIGKLMGNTEVVAQRRTIGARMSKKARADTQGCATGCKEAVEASESDRGLESGSSSSQEDLPEEPVHMAHTDPPGPEEAAVLPQDPGHALVLGLAGSLRPMAYTWAGYPWCGPGRTRKHSLSIAAHTAALCANQCVRVFQARHI